MPNLEFFLVCRSVSLDLHSDELSLSGVLEDIGLEADGKAVIPKAVAVAAWNLDPEDRERDFQALLRITRPGEAKGADFPVNVQKGRHRLRALFAIEYIPLDKPGDLQFELLLNAVHAAKHRVIVHPPGRAGPLGDSHFSTDAPQPATE